MLEHLVVATYVVYNILALKKNYKPSREEDALFLLSFVTQPLIAHMVCLYFSDHSCCFRICFSLMEWHESTKYSTFSNGETKMELGYHRRCSVFRFQN